MLWLPPPALFCFKNRYGHAGEWWVPRSHPVVWAEDGHNYRGMMKGPHTAGEPQKTSALKVRGFLGSGASKMQRHAELPTQQHLSKHLGKRKGLQHMGILECSSMHWVPALSGGQNIFLLECSTCCLSNQKQKAAQMVDETAGSCSCMRGLLWNYTAWPSKGGVLRHRPNSEDEQLALLGYFH